MARKSEPVLVVGLGRFGIALARELVRNGNEVLAVDASETQVQKLSGMIADIGVADGTDLQALEELGAADFHTAVVAVDTPPPSASWNTPPSPMTNPSV